MRFSHFEFGVIEVDGVTYEHDLVIDRGEIHRRKKKASKKYRETFGHTPLSTEEEIPWKCMCLVVGTGDLRKTPLSEAFLYYLLPQTRPGTYYIEMDPGVANADDSKLADDLRGSDLVILSKVWRYFHEPNDSEKLGSAEPNKVLRERFCTVLDYELYELLERCDRAEARRAAGDLVPGEVVPPI